MAMNRRDFSKETLMTLTSVAFLDLLFKNDLFASPVKTISAKWLKELHIMCKDLKTSKITQFEWQKQIADFHNKLPLADLLKFIDYETAVKSLQYPNKGTVTKHLIFPKVKEISENYSYSGIIFGMKKERAIIPHGHTNMSSCHRVLNGEVLLKQYDRIKDEGDYMIIKKTVEETVGAGSFSSISDNKDNVHWLVANTPYAHTFDVIIAGLHDKTTEVDNIDMYQAQKVGGDLLKVKKLSREDALEKYGDSHH